MAEPAVDPHQGPLVVLEVEHLGAVDQRARLDDDVELVVGEPRGALRDDVHAHAEERVEEPVTGRFKQLAELPVAEVQTQFILANLDELDDHGPPRAHRRSRIA